jgi:hypothetical protein
MKNIFFFMIFYALSIQANSQSCYYDAIELAGYVDPATGHFKSDDPTLIKIAEILKNYVSGLPEETGFSNVLRTITTNSPGNPGFNPILAPYLAGQVGQGSDEISGRPSVLKSIGNLDVTNFADGLAKFLVARAKEELNVAFFTKFQDFLKDFPEVKIVFPQTYDFMNEIYAYQYAAMLPALRAGFQQDMINFSDNLIRLRDLTSSDCENISDPECLSRIHDIDTFLNDKLAGRSIMAALLATNSIMKGSNAAEVLSDIASDRIVTDTNDNLSNIITFSNLISGSLRSKETEAIWVSKAELNKLVVNKDAFRIYLGLLYALDGLQSNRITFFKKDRAPITFRTLLEEANRVDSVFMDIKQHISAFGNASADVSSLARNIVRSEEEPQQSSILIYADYASAISEMLKKGVTFFQEAVPQVAADVESFIEVIDYATDACYDIKSQNYGSLVLHTSHIMEKILRGKYTYKDDYIKYGSFMAGIIEADNSDEVKAAIEAAVLPVGSSSIKRETISNISLNAYIGPMAGMEYLGGLTEDQWAPVFGVTAPLGVAFSWGKLGNGSRKDPPKTTRDNGNVKGGKSFTLFVPLIDVGSIATFRLSDENSNVAAEIKLENIIAPGLYGYWGLGKVPISIGLGGQIGPQLREINATDVNIDKNFYVRFGLNVVVDIPFFNFYTRN